MCGITGFIDFKQNSTNDYLIKMVKSLHHRGPDDSGILFENHQNTHIGIGHTRLAIIDTSLMAHQPMHFEHLSIVLNGEIYNFKELKAELCELKHKFITKSDTEVLLHAFSEWGKNCVSKFIGTFSFCILDRRNKKVFICRDRAGLRPLYYYWHNNIFLFASELKAFHCHPDFHKNIDQDALGQYFKYGNIPFPKSIFKNTWKLAPGHWLTLDLKSKKFQLEQYWDINSHYQKEKIQISYHDALTETERLLHSACNYRMVADVPVGVFLSRGFDSTAIAALLQSERTKKLKTFSIGFENSFYNEAPTAKIIAEHLGTDHTEHYCTSKDAEKIIPNLAYIYDEPFADSSAIPTILVSELAKKDVSVALSGDAGDEVFFGYKKDLRSLTCNNILENIPKALRKKVFNLFKTTCSLGTGISINFNYLENLFEELAENAPHLKNTIIKNFTYFTRPNFLKNIMPNINLNAKSYFEEQKDLEIIDQILATNYMTCLTDDMLHKIDRASMSQSLEGRAPFLDYRLVEFVAQLPSHFKLQKLTMKKILKDIVYKYIPETVLNQPKIGFRIPIFNWLRKDLSYFLDEYCSPTKLERLSFINSEQVTLAINKFKEGSSENNNFIWQMMVFQQWYDRWISK